MRLFCCIALVLLPLACQALPQPQTGVSADKITEKSGTYDQNTPEVDGDLIKELFGTQNNQNQGSNNQGNYEESNEGSDDQGNYEGSVEGHGANLNENYEPPKDVKIKDESSDCGFYKEDGFKCVPYYQCDDFGEIIVDGGPGIIDLRGNFGDEIELDPENSKCEGFLEVCCRHPSYTGPLKPKPQPYVSKCGTRNIDGIGVRISNNEYDANTQFGEFPHMCAVLEEKLINGEKKNLFVSGASLIAPGIVMTAAHSIFNYSFPNANPLKVRCGEWDTQQTVEPAEHQDRYVDYIDIHPGYSTRNYSNNVALLYAKEDFVLSAHVDIICLPNLDQMQDSYQHEDCVATGWGKDKFDSSGEYQTILKKVDLDIVGPYQCQSELRKTKLGENFNLDPTFTCAGGERAVDTCKGDGGGPLICPNGKNNGYGPQYVQAGITAWGVGCGKENVPGVYTDVAEMLCFIDWSSRCQKGDDDHYGQDITGCKNWAVRERARLLEVEAIYNYQANAATDKRTKRKAKFEAKKHKLAAKRFSQAIKNCKSLQQDEEKEDFGDYDEELDLSGYLRIGESLSNKKALLESTEEQPQVGERSATGN